MSNDSEQKCYGVLYFENLKWNALAGIGREYFEYCQNTAIPLLKKNHPNLKDDDFMIVKIVEFDNTVVWNK